MRTEQDIREAIAEIENDKQFQLGKKLPDILGVDQSVALTQLRQQAVLDAYYWFLSDVDRPRN